MLEVLTCEWAQDFFLFLEQLRFKCDLNLSEGILLTNPVCKYLLARSTQALFGNLKDCKMHY